MRYLRDCRHALSHPQGDHKGRPYYATKRLARVVHSRGDGLSSPWGGVVALLWSPLHLQSHFYEGCDCACETHWTIFSGVIGISAILMPKGLSASSTALVTAGGATIRPPSPPPLTPYAV
jgi:hypothetical protein